MAFGTKKIFFGAVVLFNILFALSFVFPVQAGFRLDNFSETSGLNKTAEGTGHNDPKLNTDPSVVVANVIKAFLSFLGVLFLGLMIYGGYIWMTSRGNEQRVTKAKNILTNSIIGLIIVLAAYGITIFVSTNIKF